MMALSIIGPMASVSPASVITLIVCPSKQADDAHQHRERQRQNGDEVMRHCPRNSRITSEHSMAPMVPSCTSAATEART